MPIADTFYITLEFQEIGFNMLDPNGDADRWRVPGT